VICGCRRGCRGGSTEQNAFRRNNWDKPSTYIFCSWGVLIISSVASGLLPTVAAEPGTMEEDEALDLMDAAATIYRSVRTMDGNLSFIDGSGFDVGPTEDGNWYGRGQQIMFEMRFQG